MKHTFSFANQSHTLSLNRSSDAVELELDDTSVTISKVEIVAPLVTFFHQDRPVTAYVIQSGNKRWVHVDGTTLVLTREHLGARHARAGSTQAGTGSGIVIAPMPGQVRAILVKEGDEVVEAQPLLILEAMKMELKVLAPHAGIVSMITIAQGASVEREQILGEIKERT